MSIYEKIGKHIVALRKKGMISQEKLAYETEMSVTYLRAIEHGKANPSVRSLERIAKALGATFFDIVSVTK